jgi:hypothetical protein
VVDEIHNLHIVSIQIFLFNMCDMPESTKNLSNVLKIEV